MHSILSRLSSLVFSSAVVYSSGSLLWRYVSSSLSVLHAHSLANASSSSSSSASPQIQSMLWTIDKIVSILIFTTHSQLGSIAHQSADMDRQIEVLLENLKRLRHGPSVPDGSIEEAFAIKDQQSMKEHYWQELSRLILARYIEHKLMPVLMVLLNLIQLSILNARVSFKVSSNSDAQADSDSNVDSNGEGKRAFLSLSYYILEGKGRSRLLTLIQFKLAHSPCMPLDQPMPELENYLFSLVTPQEVLDCIFPTSDQELNDTLSITFGLYSQLNNTPGLTRYAYECLDLLGHPDVLVLYERLYRASLQYRPEQNETEPVNEIGVEVENAFPWAKRMVFLKRKMENEHHTHQKLLDGLMQHENSILKSFIALILYSAEAKEDQ